MPAVNGVRHSFELVNGIRMHVAEAGDPGAEPLVLLHGWPQHWYVWRKLIGPLSERYRVICPDLRGFGWSEAPRGSYLKADLGMVGFHVCLKAPDRVSHYAAAAISHLWVRADEAPLSDRLRLLSRLWYMFLIASPLAGRQVVERVPAFIRQILVKGSARPDTFTEAEIGTFVAQWSEPERARACVALYRSFLTREFRQIARGAFNDQVISQPTMILIGELDPVIEAENLRGAETNLPNLEIRELAGVGHFVPEEAPEETLAALLELYDS